jgi:hypothetical protein
VLRIVDAVERFVVFGSPALSDVLAVSVQSFVPMLVMPGEIFELAALCIVNLGRTRRTTCCHDGCADTDDVKHALVVIAIAYVIEKSQYL